MLKPQRLTGILCGLGRRTGVAVWYHGGTNQDGPERGVCTSGRGLADAYEERQL